MSTKIRIEKNIPMPKRFYIPPLPLESMAIGDSFTLNASNRSEKNAIRQKLHRFQVRNKPKKFSVKTVDSKTVRVFRIEDAK